jgi:hypothetical protein
MSVTYKDLGFTSFPDSIQTFTTMQDVESTDGALIKQYQTAIENGDIATAQTIYQQIPNADNKIINSIKINALQDTAMALERFFKSDLTTYIAQKQQEWLDIINQFSLIGEYSNTSSYKQHNLVYFPDKSSNVVYIALSDVPVGVTPLNPSYWRQLTIQGEKGDKGDGISYLGDWSSTENYETNVLVTYQNGLYLSLQTPNTGNVPPDSLAYWELIGNLTTATYSIVPINEPPSSLEEGELWFGIVE